MRKFFVIGAVLLLVVGLIWWRSNPPASAEVKETPLPASPTSSDKSAQPQTIFASDSSGESAPSDAATEMTLQRPVIHHDTNAQQQVDQLSFVLRDYRLALSQNPIGTNAEITAALLGNNRKQVRFDIPAGSSIKNNELCDPWGVAYFFHQLSNSSMEIRSAGPDQTMWTNDDLIAR